MFKVKPFKYQEKAIHFGYNSLLRYGYFAALMEMGTGKTKVNLNISELLKQSDRLDNIIIIPPKMLIGNWIDEIEKQTYFDPDIFIWKNSKPLVPFKSEKLNIIFINIECFSRSNKYLKSFLQGTTYNTLCILDESTKIKNPKAKRTKNLLAYTKDIQYKAILTGTEITTSLLDLYTQFEFLKPGFWGLPNFWMFRSKYAEMEDVYIPGRKPFKKVVGFRRMAELQAQISHCTFRALKKDCLDLPEKVFQTISIEPSKEQKRVYEELKQNLMAEFEDHTLTVQQKVVLFTRFRQIAGGFMPESGALLSRKKLDFIIEDSEDYQGKVVIWAIFKPEVAFIHENLPGTLRFSGDESAAQKEEAVSRFKNDTSIKYLVLTPQSAAFGLNLQFSSLVYKYSRLTSPELEKQSIDRTHRIGSVNKVTYKILETKGTNDERVSEILENREMLSGAFRSKNPGDFFKLI